MFNIQFNIYLEYSVFCASCPYSNKLNPLFSSLSSASNPLSTPLFVEFQSLKSNQNSSILFPFSLPLVAPHSFQAQSNEAWLVRKERTYLANVAHHLGCVHKTIVYISGKTEFCLYFCCSMFTQ